MEKLILFILFSLVLNLSLISNAAECDELYTGSVVMDKYRNGQEKTLKSIEKIGKDFGDSSPVDTILLKKEFIETKSFKTGDLSLSVALKAGKLEIEKQVYSQLKPWKDDSEYFVFSEFDAEKFKTDVNKHREPAESKLLVTNIEIILLNAKKEICKKSLQIDTH